MRIKKIKKAQCGLVGWALSRKVKGCQFDSQSGHMPVLQASPHLGRVQ